MLMANMTLFAPDGLEMIMMERFEGLTTKVDCKGDDGEMSLTLKSNEALDYAMQSWSHINKKKEDKFILIANHDGCGPDDERQSYFITKVTPDRKTLTIFLTAQPAPWSEIAQTYDIDFGHALRFADPNLHARWFGEDLWNGAKDFVEDVGDAAGDAVDAVGNLIESGVDAVGDFFEDGADFAGGFLKNIGNIVQGNIKISKSMDFPVGVRNENERSNIYSDSKGRLKLDCVNCFVAGKFIVTGRVSVHHFQISEFSVAAAPRKVHAALVLEASINAGKAGTINEAKELFSAPIPGVGIAVPGIFKLGGVLTYEVGVSATFKGSAKVDFGLKASIPDESVVQVDIANSGNSKAAGFKPKVEPVFEVKGLDASLSVSAYSQPKLFFGIEIVKAAKADVSLAIRLPEVSATFTPKFDKKGACSHKALSPKTAVEIESKIKLAVIGAAEASILKWGKDYTKELIAHSWPIFNKCVPIAIPGLGGAKAVPPTKLSGWLKLPFAKLPIGIVGTKFPGIDKLTAFPVKALPTAKPVIKLNKGVVVPPPLRAALKKAAKPASVTFRAGGLPNTVVPKVPLVRPTATGVQPLAVKKVATARLDRLPKATLVH